MVWSHHVQANVILKNLCHEARALVRVPAIRCRHCRSIPTAAPRSKAVKSRRVN